MTRKYQGSSLLLTVMVLSSVLGILFLTRDSFSFHKKIIQNYHSQYLTDKWRLFYDFKENNNGICATQKKESVSIAYTMIKYQFHCQKHSIFLVKKPTKKYIKFSQIENELDINHFNENIYYIDSLTKLPITSEKNPAIVVVLNDINESLIQDFYGIIITHHYFNITGKKIYGVLYSSYDNEREERNLTYSSKVIQHLENKLTYWDYLTNSRNILNND